MVVVAHEITARVLKEEDQTRSPGDQNDSSEDESTTSIDSLEKLSNAFESFGIMDLVHKAVVALTF